MIYITLIVTFFTIIYSSVIGIIIYGFVRQKNSSSPPKINKQDANKISVIIPARNEREHIINCLQTLENQHFDKRNFEVLVINDHSVDNTVELLNDYKKTTEMNLQIISLVEKFSKKEALRLGVKKAQYSIIATTDADCTMPNNWLTHISLNINKHTDMLLGPVMFMDGNGFLYHFQVLDMLAIQGVEFGSFYLKQPIINNAANLAYKKEPYYKLKGYDNYGTPSGDDIFLLEKFKNERKSAIKGLLNSNFIVITDFQHTFKAFWNQRLRWTSKSKYYKDKFLIFISLLILIQNIFQLFIYFELLFVEKFKLVYLFLVFYKWLFDFILLLLTSSFFKKKKSIAYFIPVQVIYPFYIIFVGIISNWANFEWKERNING